MCVCAELYKSHNIKWRTKKILCFPNSLTRYITWPLLSRQLLFLSNVSIFACDHYKVTKLLFQNPRVLVWKPYSNNSWKAPHVFPIIVAFPRLTTRGVKKRTEWIHSFLDFIHHLFPWAQLIQNCIWSVIQDYNKRWWWIELHLNYCTCFASYRPIFYNAFLLYLVKPLGMS